MDTMSPDQHASGKYRNPFSLESPDFVSASHARGTREIVMSGNSPRSLLLHIPPTDPPRWIYCLADSPQWDFRRPRFDPSTEGAMTTARPPLLLIICPCLSLLSMDYCLVVTHSAAVVLTVRTLCLRREEWDHDPSAVTTRNLENNNCSCNN